MKLKISTDLIKPKLFLKAWGDWQRRHKICKRWQKAYVLDSTQKSTLRPKFLPNEDGIIVEVFSIIYKLSERVQALLEEQRPRIRTEEITGSARILAHLADRKITNHRRKG